MSQPGMWLISFAGSTIRIEAHSEAAMQIVSFLYQDMSAAPADGAVVPHTHFRLMHATAPTDPLSLYRDDQLLYKSDDQTALAERLLGESCYQLADQSRGGLLFHAAGVRYQGKGVLLAGASGAGKTTLTTWLLTQGFDYLTDELVFIPFGTRIMQTFRRPLNLKATARPVLESFLDIDALAPACLRSATTDLIPAMAIHPQRSAPDPHLDLIVFPRYQADCNFTLRSLSKAHAGLSLMETLVNARNLPEHGFQAITTLARQVPAYQMQYANFGQIVSSLATLINQA